MATPVRTPRRSTSTNRGMITEDDGLDIVIPFPNPTRLFSDDWNENPSHRRGPDAWLMEQRAERFETWLSKRTLEIAGGAVVADPNETDTDWGNYEGPIEEISGEYICQLAAQTTSYVEISG